MTRTLAEQFDALHAERERTWEPGKLARNVAQRRALVDAFDPTTVVRAGDRVEPFTLEWSSGGDVTLDELTPDGPVALIFFRFAGCPACNIALPHYDRTLAPALRAAGIRTVAVSPHVPEEGLDDIRQRHALSFGVASDRGNRLARRFGIAFTPLDSAPGGDVIGRVTRTGSDELPQPAVVLIDRNQIVQFVDVSPDWLRRTESERVLDALLTVA